MFKLNTKNIITVLLWLIVLAIIPIALITNYIPSSYIKTHYTVISSTKNYGGPHGSIQYELKGAYKANSGKTYYLTTSSSFSGSDENGNYVYYNPTNPSQYKLPSAPIAVLVLSPLFIAGVITFVIHSKITFQRKTKSKKQ